MRCIINTLGYQEDGEPGGGESGGDDTETFTEGESGGGDTAADRCWLFALSSRSVSFPMSMCVIYFCVCVRHHFVRRLRVRPSSFILFKALPG